MGRSAEDRRNKSAVRESGRISELKCLELFEGIVPWICGGGHRKRERPNIVGTGMSFSLTIHCTDLD